MCLSSNYSLVQFYCGNKTKKQNLVGLQLKHIKLSLKHNQIKFKQNITFFQLDALVNSMKDNLIEKGKELQEYTEKHKIRYISEKELREESERNMMKK